MTDPKSRKMQLTDDQCVIWDQLFPILEEYLPAELVGRVKSLLLDLESLWGSEAFLELAELYRALLTFMPEKELQIRAAYQATAFKHDSNGAEDWEKFEKHGLSC